MLIANVDGDAHPNILSSNEANILRFRMQEKVILNELVEFAGHLLIAFEARTE